MSKNYMSRSIREKTNFLNYNLTYEFEMLITTIEKYYDSIERNLKGQPIDKFNQNLLFESFINHCGNLIVFFTERLNKVGVKRKAINAIAVDYFIVEKNWYKILESSGYEIKLKEFKVKIDKEGLQLTYFRKDKRNVSKLWKLEIVDMLYSLLINFLNELLPMYFSLQAKLFFQNLQKRISLQIKRVHTINKKLRESEEKNRKFSLN